MKTIPSALQTYLDANKSYFDRNYIWLTLTSGTTYGFCDADQDETLDVIDPATGTATSRTYLGGIHIDDIPDLVDSPEMTIRSVTIPLSMASADVAEMITTEDLRGAAVEWHKGFVSEDTNALISEPECEFLGFVNGISINEGGAEFGSDGIVSDTAGLECVSYNRELTRTNLKTRSYQAGLERSGDEIFKYANSAHRWKIRWGKESRSHDEGRSRPRGKNDALNGGNPSR